MNKTDITRKDKTGFTELEDKYWRALLLIQSHVNEPEVVKSIVDKAIGRPEDVTPLEEPEDEDDIPVNAPSAEALAKGAFGDDHFGEEQAEGLDNLLEGLRDGPKDKRW